MTRKKSLSLADMAVQAGSQPSAEEIRAGIHGLENRLHSNENSQQGPQRRTPLAKGGGGRKDNAPPMMLRRGQNR